MEFYFKVFYEEAWANSLIPFASEATFTSMISFGGYNMIIASIIATAGATVGLIFNWFLGQLLLKMHVSTKLHVSEENYQRASTIFNKYCIFVLFFSWAPLCKVILLLAGFLNSRLKFVLPLAVVGQLIYHLSKI